MGRPCGSAEGTGQNPGEALDLVPSLGPSSICSLVTRSEELSRHLFSYGPECAESLSANCSPSRGLPVLLFVRMVSVQLFLVVLTVPHGGTGRAGGPNRAAGAGAGGHGLSERRPLGLLAALPCGLRAGPPAVGGGSLAPCLSFPPGGPWQLMAEEWLLRAGRSVSLGRELRPVNPELFDVKFLCFFCVCKYFNC